jgi:DNA-3-methyladenine glycosylase II
LGIRKAINNIIGREINGDELEKVGERWKPYRTIASWYLWRSLEDV